LQQSFVHEIVTDIALPACQTGRDLCGEVEENNCYRLGHDTEQLSETAVCYSCAAPAAAAPVACDDESDCGDRVGAFCGRNEDGSGTCRQLCGGIAFDATRAELRLQAGFGLSDRSASARGSAAEGPASTP
jgi:hypothetical protein